MKSIKIIIILFVVSVLLPACTQDNNRLILGVWEGDQASQKVGSDEELGHFNYLEMK